MADRRRVTTVAALGTAQTLAWASTFYLPAVLAPTIAKDLGLSVPTVFLAFSWALVVSAGIGPYAGRAIDRWGGRPVLMATNLVFAAGLALLGAADSLAVVVLAWTVLGVGMGSGLYEAAFAALVRLHGRDSRGMITGITLIAGFASTIGWPLSTLLDAQLGWRGACWAWAAMHLAIGIPLNASLPRIEPSRVLPPAREPGAATGAPARSEAPAGPPPSRWTGAALAFVFATVGFTGTAMAAHFPMLLQAAGASLAAAVAAGALIGPAQVGARLLEFGFMQRLHPLVTARLSLLAHPVGVALLLALGSPAAAAFALVHGAGNGLLTIVKGTLPLALFGPQGYGERQGLLMMPSRIAQALAPWLFGVCLERWGAGALWVTAALGFAAAGALATVRPAGDARVAAPAPPRGAPSGAGRPDP
jgi:predicted MFS family arabinose efflux permease